MIDGKGDEKMSDTMSLKAALKRAAELGMRVHLVPRTGEVRVWDGDRPITCNNRKKDAPKVLLAAIRRREKGTGRER